MSRLCRLRKASHGEEGRWAYKEITQLRAEVAKLRKDAERYRYLRHISRRECLAKNGPEAGCWIDCEDENRTLILLTEEDADAAIDAAILRGE